MLAVLDWLRDAARRHLAGAVAASGAEDQPDWRDVVAAAAAGRRGRRRRRDALPHLSPGLLVLICADVIRPSLGWLLRFAPARRNLAAEMARTRDPAAFAELAAVVHARAGSGCKAGQQALTRIAIIMAAKGGTVAEVRVGDCLELLAARRAASAPPPASARAQPVVLPAAARHGGLGPDAPAAIEMFSGRGQPSCEQLIDRYRIACRPVRDVLVDYLRERQPSVDFSTLQNLAYLLGKLFWADLEAHHPGIDSLQAAPRRRRRLEAAGDDPHPHDHRPPTAGQIKVTEPRLDGRSVLTAVRAFYLDLAEWADDDPARWAAVGGALPGQRQRRLPQEGPLPPQVPDGPTHPRTAAGAARPGRLGGGRTRPHRRAARRRRADPARRAVHRRRGDAAPRGDEDRDHRAHLGRGPATAG